MPSARPHRTDLRADRLAVAALVGLLVVGLISAKSSAAPSQQEVEEARQRWQRAEQAVSRIAEDLNLARIRLDAVQVRMDGLRRERMDAQQEESRARTTLAARASAAYQGLTSQWASLLAADDFSDFSDRLAFLDSIAQADAELATLAERAQERAARTLADLAELEDERRSVVQELSALRADAEEIAREAEAAFEDLDEEYRDSLSPPVSQILPGGPPPAPNGGAQAAIDAAFSVRGTPYVFGASSPGIGFDCSGLTMWAWSHAGVSLPHSSQMQYAVLPKVDRSELQPGDLIFFYSPISHVGIYLTPTTMIDANHTGDVVNVRPIHWENFVGAARP